jgi:hypothetical protein
MSAPGRGLLSLVLAVAVPVLSAGSTVGIGVADSLWSGGAVSRATGPMIPLVNGALAGWRGGIEGEA